MELGTTIVDVGDAPEAWWVVGIFTIVISAAVIVSYLRLPQKHKWLALLIPVFTFFTTPWLIRKIIDHILNIASGEVVVHSYFFDWPRYYPSIIAFGIAVILSRYKRHAVA